ncbi:hypothetical protein Mgra_00009442 [Meloidogyne graminicola]|uniref:Uncharacterized protein n=1 Tax=Meloidogyne graminicola TaxID=189291 RepID=A0A8S9ZC55_9BILA|nr:hypothetical protein Mgra_00009442 [Meloidogyne graminicola]
MNINDYNSRVDYINNASRQLEKKLCEESIKLHNELQSDFNGKKYNNNYNNSSKNDSSFSSKSSPNRYYEIHSKEDPYKPINFWSPAVKLVNFEGPTTKSIPLDDGKIGGSITTWQWTKESERHF